MSLKLSSVRMDKDAIPSVRSNRKNSILPGIELKELTKLRHSSGKKVHRVLDECSPQTGMILEEHYEKRPLRKRKELPPAIKESWSLDQQHEEHRDFILSKAESLACKNEYLKAIPYYEAALKSTPEDIAVIFSLLDCFFMTADYESFFYYADFLKKRYLDNTEVCQQLLIMYQEIAKEYYADGQYEDAEFLYKEAFSFVRENKKASASIFLALGNIHIIMQDIEAAHDCFLFAVENDPSCEEASAKLKILKSRRGEDIFDNWVRTDVKVFVPALFQDNPFRIFLENSEIDNGKNSSSVMTTAVVKSVVDAEGSTTTLWQLNMDPHNLNVQREYLSRGTYDPGFGYSSLFLKIHREKKVRKSIPS